MKAIYQNVIGSCTSYATLIMFDCHIQWKKTVSGFFSQWANG